MDLLLLNARDLVVYVLVTEYIILFELLKSQYCYSKKKNFALTHLELLKVMILIGSGYVERKPICLYLFQDYFDEDGTLRLIG